MKKSYLIEDQINACYKFLHIPMKNAHDMTENEIELAETFLSRYFRWVNHPDYIQNIPEHIRTGHLVL